MGVRGKGEREALFKGFPLPLPPAAGGMKKGRPLNAAALFYYSCENYWASIQALASLTSRVPT